MATSDQNSTSAISLEGSEIKVLLLMLYADDAVLSLRDWKELVLLILLLLFSPVQCPCVMKGALNKMLLKII